MRTLILALAGPTLLAASCAGHNLNARSKTAPVMVPKPAPAPKVKQPKPVTFQNLGIITVNPRYLGCKLRFREAEVSLPLTWVVTDCQNKKQWRLKHYPSGTQALLTFRWTRRTPAKLISRFKQSIRRRQGVIIGHTGRHHRSQHSRIVFHLPKQQPEPMVGQIWSRKLTKYRFGQIEIVAVWTMSQDKILDQDLEALFAGIR